MPGDPYHLPKCPTCGRGMQIIQNDRWRCAFCFNLVFRIRKRYYDLIVSGDKTVEYRRDIPFWQVRLANIFGGEAIQDDFQVAPMHSGVQVFAIFICGKRKHTREIVGVERIPTPAYFSEQGKKDVNTPTCLAFHLGEEV